MDKSEAVAVSVADTEVPVMTEKAVPYPNDVADDIWRVVNSMMERARRARGLTPDVDFEEYLDFLDTITAGELWWCLFEEDEDRQMSIVNEWLDEMRMTRHSAVAA